MEKEKMSKSEIKALNKEICEFYLDNGWRGTLSKFSLSPKQAAEVIPDKLRLQRKDAEKAEKKATKATEKAERKEARKAAKAADPAAEKAPRKRKAKASEDDAVEPKVRKKPGRKPGKKAGATPVPADVNAVLDYLIAYRKNAVKAGTAMLSIDDCIISLAEQSRSES